MWMGSQLPTIGKQLRAAGFLGSPADPADLTKVPLSEAVKSADKFGQETLCDQSLP
jgi:hypothetical protein